MKVFTRQDQFQRPTYLRLVEQNGRLTTYDLVYLGFKDDVRFEYHSVMSTVDFDLKVNYYTEIDVNFNAIIVEAIRRIEENIKW